MNRMRHSKCSPHSGTPALAAFSLGFIDMCLGGLDRLFEKTRGKRFKDGPLAAILIAPSALILGVFGIGPLVMALYMSFFRRRGLASEFAGLANYVTALRDPEFWNSVRVTLYYALGLVPLSLILSFLVASGLYRIARGRGLLRTVYFLPYVTSAVAAGTVWRAMLDPRFGIINSLLGKAGIPAGALPQWLLEPKGVLHIVSNGMIPADLGPSLALCCVVTFDVWHTMGFMVVILLAGLTAIPRELEEAAVIDGASWRHISLHVTLPLLSPTLFFLAIVSVIRAFQAFNSFYALTGDGSGPVNTTRNLIVYMYDFVHRPQSLGYATAVATLMALAVIGLTLFQWRFVGRRVYYE